MLRCLHQHEDATEILMVFLASCIAIVCLVRLADDGCPSDATGAWACHHQHHRHAIHSAPSVR